MQITKLRKVVVGSEMYLVVRIVLHHTRLDVIHEGINKATAVSHGLSFFLLGTAQVPVHI